MAAINIGNCIEWFSSSHLQRTWLCSMSTEYAHDCIAFYSIMVTLSYLWLTCDIFIYIHQGCCIVLGNRKIIPGIVYGNCYKRYTSLCMNASFKQILWLTYIMCSQSTNWEPKADIKLLGRRCLWCGKDWSHWKGNNFTHTCCLRAIFLCMPQFRFQ